MIDKIATESMREYHQSFYEITEDQRMWIIHEKLDELIEALNLLTTTKE